ncbi:flagellar export protein FliJ [bacterium]|nr:flagellar export protein FliJ [bacterium]
MKAFRFRMEKVLQLRRQIEDEKKRELSILLFDLRQQEARLHSLERELEECKADLMSDLQEREISVPRLMVFAAYMERRTLDIKSQQERILELHKTIEAKRKELMEAMQNRMSMERVRAQRQAEYRADALREEINFLDEVGGFQQVHAV